ncbi:MAG: alpha/beta hydrolase [Burkholderiaceae bacterium]|nr:alpha/beta hydrolase [Burkholderiaceae bacterium]
MNTRAAQQAASYVPKKTSRSEFITVRDLRYHVRHWGSADAPKLFMLHGWMDMSASFQFLVDSLQREWHVIVPDWRGFGLTEFAPGHSYWFPNYIADLDAVVRHYSPDKPILLLGHSMGGNISTIYAGVRPEKILKLVNLEGYGLPSTRPTDAPLRYRMWMDQLLNPPLPKTFASQADVINLLQKVNPRLPYDRAVFLSANWAAQNKDGLWEIQADPMHRNSNPLLYRAEEALACWSEITAPTLWVEAEYTDIWQRLGTSWNAIKSSDETVEERRARLKRQEIFSTEFELRLNSIPDLTRKRIAGTGHMLHHDQPEQVARIVEEFLLT